MSFATIDGTVLNMLLFLCTHEYVSVFHSRNVKSYEKEWSKCGNVQKVLKCSVN